ncbi:fungal specific transcription factor [Aspergillus bombycis]|uniref:Fungal specific transcription factor n=1 Tax=Aspergillus bombycis TaxID=109264 RepID=A0A1F8ADH8_9EURO|nr:fungal specific transcription factor [Aspergillus bombycis]OGM49469.1 fungal specific transcription factor [Aspergillus bombycis]
MDAPAHKAAQACVSCRTKKRKCDKLLPECSLCVRTCRTCHYTGTPRLPPTADEFAALQERFAELEDRLHTSSEHTDSVSGPGSVSGAGSFATETSAITWLSKGSTGFPSALFLDLDCYKWSNMQLPRPAVNIPMEVLEILAQQNTVLETLPLYFGTIHRWMPIVSKKRLELGISLQNSGPDLAMLFLSMKLNISPPPAEDIGAKSLYSTAKSFLATLEAGGVVSLAYLQAMILVAVYEYSHSIYPAAWMTVGACTRLAELLGLSSGTDSMKIMGRITTWTEVEERRRAWWAIYVLDRVISVGSRRRIFFPEPANDHILPVDDEAWDSGNVTNIVQHSCTVPLSTHVSSFARLCQSAMFISRVVAYRSRAQAALVLDISAVTSLTEEICSFGSILTDETTSSTLEGYLRLLPAQCLAWSALFMLLDSYCCPEKLSDEPGYTLSGDAKGPAELATQVRATLVVRNISDQAHEHAKKLMDIISTTLSMDILGSASPFSLDALYCSMVTFQWIYREGGEDLARTQLADMEACMGKLGERWRLASEYLVLNELWDKDISKYNFKVVESIQPEVDGISSYIPVVHEHIDSKSRKSTLYVNVNTEPLRDILPEVIENVKTIEQDHLDHINQAETTAGGVG